MTYKSDWKIQRIVERTLQVLIELCIDMANHIISDEDLRLSTGYADTFRVLMENNIISKELCKSMEKMAKFRNVIVHQYESIEPSIIISILHKNLVRFREISKSNHQASALIKSISKERYVDRPCSSLSIISSYREVIMLRRLMNKLMRVDSHRFTPVAIEESSELLRAEGATRAPLIDDQRGPVLAQRGFTLIEIIVVVTIVGLLLALVGPKIISGLGKGQQGAAKAQVELLGQTLDAFRLDVGRYPTTQEGLSALITNPGITNWDGPYIKKNEIPKDPWGKPYIYQCPGTHGEYDLYSYGADGTQGGEKENKDILSWE